jgi:hypothetical protein
MVVMMRSTIGGTWPSTSGTWLSASVKNSTDYVPAEPVCQLLDRYCHDSR